MMDQIIHSSYINTIPKSDIINRIIWSSNQNQIQPTLVIFMEDQTISQFIHNNINTIPKSRIGKHDKPKLEIQHKIEKFATIEEKALTICE